MMYVGRTQIYLGESEIALLERAGRATGASRSELIRRAIHAAYAEAPADERIEALLRTAGAWAGRKETGAEIVETLRSGLERRLQALGLE